MGDDEKTVLVECDDCGEVVQLYRKPLEGLRLLCHCPEKGIDVSGRIADANLFDPFSGAWSDIDAE